MERVHMQLAQLTHALGNLHLVAGVGETPLHRAPPSPAFISFIMESGCLNPR